MAKRPDGENREKPKWIRQLEAVLSQDDSSDYWKGKSSSLPLRYHGGRTGFDPIFSSPTASRGGSGLSLARSKGNLLSDNASNCSSSSSSSSDRRDKPVGSRRLGLILMLLLGAALIGSIVGAVVYILLRPDSSYDQYNAMVAEVSVKILNETYTDVYSNSTSAEFRALADPFCGAVNEYFEKSALASRYSGCQVMEISNGSLIVNFHLVFVGEKVEHLEKKIPTVISDFAPRKNSTEFEMVYIGDHLVSVKKFASLATTTAAAGVGRNRASLAVIFDSVRVDLSVPVFNLTDSVLLANRTSEEFLRLAAPFCADVSNFVLRSNLSERFESCAINSYGDYPPSVNFSVVFRGNDTEELKEETEEIIRQSATRVSLDNGSDLLLVGRLLLLPGNITTVWKPLNSTGEPSVTTPFPDSVAFNGLLSNLSIPIFNLTYSPDLTDNSSELFIDKATWFCHDLENMFHKSNLSVRFYFCSVKSFKNEPSRINIDLTFYGNDTTGLKEEIIDVIFFYAKHVQIDNKELLLVGDLLIFPYNLSVPLMPINITNKTTAVPGTTLLPTIHSDIVFSDVILTMSLPVYNLTYTPVLSVNTSSVFLHYKDSFCADLTRIFSYTWLIDRYMECNIETFENQPVRISFSLMFSGNTTTDLAKNVTSSMLEHGKKVFFNKLQLIKVGELLVDVTEAIYIWIPTNQTQWNTPPFTQVSSTTYLPSDMTHISITMYLYNFTYTNNLNNLSSPEFTKYSVSICSDVNKILKQSSLDSEYGHQCKINSFSDNFTRANMVLTFIGTNSSNLTNVIVEDIILSLSTSVEYLGYKMYLLGGFLVSLHAPDELWISTTATTDSSITFWPQATTFDAILVNISWWLYNFTFTDRLEDSSSDEFQRYALPFCEDLKNIFSLQSPFSERFYKCIVHNFVQNPSSIQTVLIFNGTDTSVINDKEITQVVKRAVLPFNVQGNIEAYAIGPLFIVFENSSVFIQPTNISYYESTSTTFHLETSTIASPFTTFSYTDQVFVDVTWLLYNFTFFPFLEDPTSKPFQKHSKHFCQKLQSMLRTNTLQHRYQNCKIISFRHTKNSTVAVALVFKGYDSSGIENDLLEGIKSNAEPVIGVNVNNLYKVGDLIIYLYNYTFMATPNKKDTTTIEIVTAVSWTNITYGYADSIAVTIDFSVYDPPEPLHKDSFQTSVCADMDGFYKSSLLADRYLACIVKSVSNTPPKMTSVLVFNGTDKEHLGYIAEIVRKKAPRLNLTEELTIYLIGGLQVILDNATWSMKVANQSSIPTTSFRTTTPNLLTTAEYIYYDGVNAETILFPYNLTYIPELGFPSSEEFKNLENLLCEDFRSIFAKSNLADNYRSCSVASFGNKPSTANFSLVFQGLGITGLSDNIFDVIKRGVLHANTSEGSQVYFIGSIPFWLKNTKISLHPLNMTDISTTTILTVSVTTVDWSSIGDGVLANMTFLLYNFTFTSDLTDPSSSEFNRKSTSFCKNVGNLMLKSPDLARRYTGCHINNYGDKPPSVRFFLIFKGSQPTNLDSSIINTMRKFTSQVNVSRGTVSVVGDFYVWLRNSSTSLHPINLTDTITTTTVAPTTTIDWTSGNGVLMNTTFILYNFTLTHELTNPSSSEFKKKGREFCKDVGNVILKGSHLAGRFADCSVMNYGNEPSINFRLIFHGPNPTDIPGNVKKTIANFAPHFNISEGSEVYWLGGVFVWLKNSSLSVHPVNVSDESTTLTTEATTVPLTTVDWSSMGDGVMANTTFILYNFTMTTDLHDKSSFGFKGKSQRFCTELENLLVKSSRLMGRFEQCNVASFSNEPPSVQFFLAFRGSQPTGIDSDIVNVVETFAPRVNVPSGTVSVVGDFYVWLRNSSTSLHPINLTDTITTTTVAPTTTIDWTSGNGVLMNTTFILYNFTLTHELTNPSSSEFKKKGREFCKDVGNVILKGSHLAGRFADCSVMNYGNEPSINFRLIFHGPNPTDIPGNVKKTIANFAPHFNISEGSEVYWLGGVFVWLKNSSLSVHPVNVSDESTTLTTEATTVPLTTVDWSSMGDYVLVNATVLLYNFTETQPFDDLQSFEYQFHEKSFCVNMKHIVEESLLAQQMLQCKIIKFGKVPTTVQFILVFSSLMLGPVHNFLQIIKNEAEPVKVEHSFYVYKVGDLLLKLDNFTISVHSINSTPEITTEFTSPGSTTTQYLPFDYTLFDMTVDLYDFVFQPQLDNVTSPGFLNHALPFCRDVDDFFSRSHHTGGEYAGCEVKKFRKEPAEINFHLLFNTSHVDHLKKYVSLVFEEFALHVGTVELILLKVGDLILVWENRTLLFIPTYQTSEFSRHLFINDSAFVQPTVNFSSTPSAFDTTKLIMKFLLLNFTFDPNLRKSNSESFKNLSSLICSNLSSLFIQSGIRKSFQDCAVESFDFEPSIKLSLVFDKEHVTGDLVRMLQGVLKDASKSLGPGGSLLIPVGDLLFIWENHSVSTSSGIALTTNSIQDSSTAAQTDMVHMSTLISPTPTKSPASIRSKEFASHSSAPPGNTVVARMKLKLFSLNYTDDLKDRSSPVFRSIADLFCQDIEKFYTKSKLAAAYQSCEIVSFGNLPALIEAELKFNLETTNGLQEILVDVLNHSAPHVQKNNKDLLQIGNLFVILGKVIPGVLDTQPSFSPLTKIPSVFEMSTFLPTTVSSLVTSALTFTFNLFNFTFDPRLTDSSTMVFQNHAESFCKKVDIIYKQSALSADYSSCHVLSFKPHPARVKFELSFKSDTSSNKNDALKAVLRESSSIVEFAGLALLKIGDYWLVWKNTSELVSSSMMSTTEFDKILATHSMFSIIPSRSKIILKKESATATSKYLVTIQMAFSLYNFTYVPELSNSESLEFQQQQQRFCKDMEHIYLINEISGDYQNCTVEKIQSKPNRISFRLIFVANDQEMVHGDKIVNRLLTSAPAVTRNGYQLLYIGGLYLLRPKTPGETTGFYSSILSTSTGNYGNIIMISYPSSVMHSSSMVTLPPQEVVVVYNGTLLNIMYNLLNNSFSPSFYNKSSKEFLEANEQFCSVVARLYKDSNLSQEFHKCKIDTFSSKPSKIQFGLVFVAPLTKRLAETSLNIFRKGIPYKYINGNKILDVNGYFLIDNNSENLTQIPINVTDIAQTLTRPTLSGYSSLPVKPTLSNNLMSSSVNSGYIHRIIEHDATRANITYVLYNFNLTKELKDSSSPEFQNLSRNFCNRVLQTFSASKMKGAFRYCRIASLGIDPESVKFILVFTAPLTEALKENTISILHQTVNHTEKSGYRLINIDGLQLVLNNFSITLDAVNMSDFYHGISAKLLEKSNSIAYGIMPTPSFLQPHSTFNRDIDLNKDNFSDITMVPLNFELYNFSYTKHLDNPYSLDFKNYSDSLCNEVKVYFEKSVLSKIFHGCVVDGFRRQPNSVSFQLAFKTQPSKELQDQVLKILEQSAGHHIENGLELLDVNHLLIVWNKHSVTTNPPYVNLVSSMMQPANHASSKFSYRYKTLLLTSFTDSSVYNSELLDSSTSQHVRPSSQNAMQLSFLNQNFNSGNQEKTNIHTFGLKMHPILIDSSQLLHSVPQYSKFDFSTESLNLVDVSQSFTGATVTSFQMESMSGHNTHSFNNMWSSSVVVAGTGQTVFNGNIKKSSAHNNFLLSLASEMPSSWIKSDDIMLPSTSSLFSFTAKRQKETIFLPEIITNRLFTTTTTIKYETSINSDDFGMTDAFSVFSTPFSIANPSLQVYNTDQYVNMPLTLSASRTTDFDISTIMTESRAAGINSGPIRPTPTKSFNDISTGLYNFHLDSSQKSVPLPNMTTASALVATDSSTIVKSSERHSSDHKDIVLVTDGTVADLSYELHNLTYTPDFADEGSIIFQQMESHFCRDINNFYKNSAISTAYRDCKVVAIRQQPPTVTFRLVFAEKPPPQLENNIVNIIEKKAPRVNKKGLEMLRVGDLFLVWRNTSVILKSSIATSVNTQSLSGQASALLYSLPSSPFIYVAATSKSYIDSDIMTTVTMTNSLLNFTFIPALGESMSTIFQQYQTDFCGEVSGYYKSSELSRLFSDCKVKSFRDSPPSISFSLVFVSALKSKDRATILKVFEDFAPNLSFMGYKVLKIGRLLLVWQQLVTLNPISTAETFTGSVTTPNNSILDVTAANLAADVIRHSNFEVLMTAHLFNLSFASDLTDRNSPIYKHYAEDFCKDVNLLYRQSRLSKIFRGCKVLEFRSNPLATVKYRLVFEKPADDISITTSGIVNVLASSALEIGSNDMDLLSIGGLFVIWQNHTEIDVSAEVKILTDTQENLRPSGTFHLETSVESFTSTNNLYIFIGGSEITMTVGLFNITFSQRISAKDSEEFLHYTKPFCADIKKFYQQSQLSSLYHSCEVEAFSQEPASMTFRLIMKRKPSSTLKTQVIQVFEDFAHQQKQNNSVLLKVGRLLLVWKNFTVIAQPYNVTSAVYSVLKSEITGMGSYRIPFTSFSVSSTLTPSPAGSEIGTINIVYDATLVNITVPVPNLNMTQGLMDPTSEAFKMYSVEFCNDLKAIFISSAIGELFSTCRMVLISFQPDTVFFQLIFHSAMSDELKTSVNMIINSTIPKTIYKGQLLAKVGHFLLYWPGHQMTMYPTNATKRQNVNHKVTSVFISPTPASTVAIGSIYLDPHYSESTTVTLGFKLFNFTFFGTLTNSTSKEFQDYEKKLCRQLHDYYKRSSLSSSYDSCSLDEIRKNPSSLEFKIVFQSLPTNGFTEMVEQVLIDSADRFTIEGNDLLSIGEFLLIWQNHTVDTKTDRSHGQTVPSLDTSAGPPMHTTILAFSKWQMNVSTETSTPVNFSPKSNERTLVNIELHPYNMTYTTELADKNSAVFRETATRFCNHLSIIFGKSSLAGNYQYCNLVTIRNNPKSVNFHLIFNHFVSAEIQEKIIQAFGHFAPQAIIGNRVLIRIGDLFFFWYGKSSANAINISMKSIAGFSFNPTPTELRSLPAYTSAPMTLTYHVLLEASKLTMIFQLFNFTYSADLSNHQSDKFKRYAQHMCHDLKLVFEKTSLRKQFYNCTVESFKKDPNQITFSLIFLTKMSEHLQNYVVESLNSYRKHITHNNLDMIPFGGLSLIWYGYQLQTEVYNMTSNMYSTTDDNYSTIYEPVPQTTPIYMSISNSSKESLTIVIVYEATLANLTIEVYNLSYTPQLSDSLSKSFIDHEASICGNLDSIFNKSEKYHGCKLVSVNDDPPAINIHLVFAKPLSDTIKEEIFTSVNMSTPHMNFEGLDLIQVGDFLLILKGMQAFFLPVNLSTTTTWNSPIPADASIIPVTATQSANPSSPGSSDGNTTITVVVVYDATLANLTFEVFNLSYTPQNGVPWNVALPDFENELCGNLSHLFHASSLSSKYYTCKVNNISTNPLAVVLYLVFIAPITDTLQKTIMTVLDTSDQQIVFEGKDVLQAGSVLLAWSGHSIQLHAINISSLNAEESQSRNQGSTITPQNSQNKTVVIKYDATLINISYSLENFKFTMDLANTSSAAFRNYTTTFCDAINQIFQNTRLANEYRGCKPQKFGTSPTRIFFHLIFQAARTDSLQSNVLYVLERRSDRVPSDGNWLLKIGGLSLVQGSQSIELEAVNISDIGINNTSVDDGWVVRISLHPYNLAFTPDLLDHSSTKFIQYSDSFCTALNGIYSSSSMSSRYVGCQTEYFGKDPVSVTIKLVFRGKESLPGNELVTVVQKFSPSNNVNGSEIVSIGDVFFWLKNTTLTLQPTKLPAATLMNITFVVMNLTYTSELSDSSSAQFKELTSPFCSYLDNIYKEGDRFPTYKSCEVTNFGNNPETISFNLLFGGPIDPNLRERIISILIEKAPRASVDGQIALQVGGLLIYEKSVAIDLTHVTDSAMVLTTEASITREATTLKLWKKIATSAIPRKTVMTSIKTTHKLKQTVNHDPCLNKNSGYFPHPDSCHMFYQCAFGRSYSQTCQPKYLVFDPKIKTCVEVSNSAHCTN